MSVASTISITILRSHGSSSTPCEEPLKKLHFSWWMVLQAPHAIRSSHQYSVDDTPLQDPGNCASSLSNALQIQLSSRVASEQGMSTIMQEEPWTVPTTPLLCNRMLPGVWSPLPCSPTQRLCCSPDDRRFCRSSGNAASPHAVSWGGTGWSSLLPQCRNEMDRILTSQMAMRLRGFEGMSQCLTIPVPCLISLVIGHAGPHPFP